jgi:hypothetical protein
MSTPFGGGQFGQKKRHAKPALPVKVFIGYADLPAVRRATACVLDAARDSGRRVEIEPLLWRSQQLASGYWRDRSITAALEADLIVLTSSASGPLAPEFDQWARHFLKAARHGPTTLVVITGADAWTISLERPVTLAHTVAASPEATPPIRQKLVA